MTTHKGAKRCHREIKLFLPIVEEGQRQGYGCWRGGSKNDVQSRRAGSRTSLARSLPPASGVHTASALPNYPNDMLGQSTCSSLIGAHHDHGKTIP